MNDSISLEQLDKSIYEFIPIMKSSLVDRWNDWEINLDEQIMFEVLGGILSRQISIITQILTSISLWNGDVGPILLRSLAENYITLSWLVKEDTIIRCEQFVEHGMGQEVLLLEKLEVHTSEMELTDMQKKLISDTRKFIERERNIHVLDVNMGAWSNKSIRDMALESEMKEYYDFSFVPFTFAAHGTWNQILKYNVKESQNPFHNFMKVPVVHEYIPDLHFPNVAIMKLDECFNVVDKKLSTKTKFSSLEKRFQEIIDRTIKEG